MSITARLHNLFSAPYQRKAWLEMLATLLPTNRFATPLFLENSTVVHFYQLGRIDLADGKELGVYEIKTQPRTQLQRNRVQMRQLVAKACRNEAYDGALAVYYDDQNRWRFSFIAMEYQLDEQGLPQSKQTASKRYTYLLGEGAQIRTAVERFSKLDRQASLEALTEAFAVAQLNKEFYQKLFEWYEDAKTKVVFPNDLQVEEADHTSTSLIRLLTRLLFVWFIKEKQLINDDLFDEEKVRELIHWDKDSSYYKAILQNLFFATLNQEIEDRGFRKLSRSSSLSNSYLVTNRYRYRDHFKANDEQPIIDLYARIPFLNGGLFECLDREATAEEQAQAHPRKENKAIRIDGFSDRGDNALHVPNELFFSNEENEPGLIDLFLQYQFTVEESTPVDQEVALDPELLGQVFENLLASYNPETGVTARKQTGSFYTPREIVNYMVEETLVAALAQLCHPTDGDHEFWQERLRYLLDYARDFDDANELFDENETENIVHAIARVKVLDPAVGSGAFPMGVLHKLTLVLQRLDRHNERWEKRQKELAVQRAETAFGTKDRQERDEELLEISETFENYSGDFGHKLYLIQNNIFGVDIQPIACQIAKLRFFISLAIEQEPDWKEKNFGIKPLPNLETKFVAANTLINLDKPVPMSMSNPDVISIERAQMSMRNPDIYRKEAELAEVRRKYFTARTLKTKIKYREQDKQLRLCLSQLLIADGWGDENAAKIAQWEPYEQNTSTAFFDPEWMFGITQGFDMVIGNPPYINIENLPVSTKNYLFNNYKACEGRTDIYIAFLEKSISVLNANGTMCFILPSAFATQKYGEKMRQILIGNHMIREVVDASSYRIFENATVYNIILLVGNQKGQAQTKVRIHFSNADFDTRGGLEFFIDQHTFAELKDSRLETNPLVFNSLKVKEKIWKRAVRFDQICFVAYGARLNHRSGIVGKDAYISQSQISGSKRFCEGKNIERYTFSQEGWLNYTPNEHYNPMFPELFEKKKLMFIRVVKDRLRFAYDDEGYYNSHTVINCVRMDLLSKATHISARRAIRYSDLKLSKKYNYKFLLGVLNSEFTNWYFLSFLSDGLNFYPNDAKALPIPYVEPEKQGPIIELVDQIHALKHTDPDADTSTLELEIDQLVYELYKLTPEEIEMVARSSQNRK